MIDVSKPAVEPRAYSPCTGESHPLLDLVLDELDTENRTIRIVGEGTRTAIAFLKGALADYGGIHIAKNHESVKPANECDLAIFASSRLHMRPMADLELKLASWGKDEVIEYLLNRAPTKCKSVMGRLQESQDIPLGNGSPRVLSIALNQMIASDSVKSIEEGILKQFHALNLPPLHRTAISEKCIDNIFSNEKVILALRDLSPQFISDEVIKFLGNETVRYVICVERIVQWFGEREAPTKMAMSWPRSLIKMTAKKINNHPRALNYLSELANQKDSVYASNAASLLVAAGIDWAPELDCEQAFEDAKLANVNWPDQSFKEASLTRVDLSHSNLQDCDFEEATLTSGNFFDACTSGANFTYAYAAHSNFSNSITRAVSAHGASFPNSDFSNASLASSNLSNTNFNDSDLSRADCSGCNFKKARFLDASLDHVDFSNSIMIESRFRNCDLRTADLDNADFSGASLVGCDLRFQKLVGENFRMSKLRNSLLTGTVFRNCDLRNTNLRNAKMANIDWEDCDIRDANLIGCHFHMGSTRCGTLDSPFPSHGTRTGYYTDDFDEHYFRPPEERRVANLRGCNLLGAKVFKTDFYLVDLRDAIYDKAQKEHFKRCDAILTD